MPAVRTLVRATAITMLIATVGQQNANAVSMRAGSAVDGPGRAHHHGHAHGAEPGGAAQTAVRYAMAQVGKPYAHGGTGPGSFDCSGLTYRAWARAGVRIPRTSQQQWRQLPRVSVSRLRPGDVVVYFREASHVALYMGGGKVIQATRPGSDVQIAPLDSDPILGAVRI
jgi:cell wall-associated NlpC family hydrolase